MSFAQYSKARSVSPLGLNLSLGGYFGLIKYLSSQPDLTNLSAARGERLSVGANLALILYSGALGLTVLVG